jgi:hypothetical protein
VLEGWHEMSLQSCLRKVACVNFEGSLGRACLERESGSDVE